MFKGFNPIGGPSFLEKYDRPMRNGATMEVGVFNKCFRIWVCTDKEEILITQEPVKARIDMIIEALEKAGAFVDEEEEEEEEETTEVCPNCGSADIECEGGEFNEWFCNSCDNYFSYPKNL